MEFADEILQVLAESPEETLRAWRADAPARARLQRLAEWSGVYRDFLRRFPERWLWLEAPENRDCAFRYRVFPQIWQTEFDRPEATREEWLRALQRFRRLHSLRLAYRELGGLVTTADGLRELTLLAEFCLQTILGRLRQEGELRQGQPWEEGRARPARFCVLGLGKLGAGELNFCSDLDLIYLYQGQGHCRKAGRAGQQTNEEFFSRLAREMTSLLQSRTEEGFLYNIDLRLRPEGEGGPLVRSLSSMENYYSAAGQTWERLALVKARPVAGDAELGNEFLEGIQPFRFPRRPPAALLTEISGVKLRIEREVVGDDLSRNLKNGFGGIREIEFYLQALQMMQAGRNPFLQTPSTLEALERLERYGHLEAAPAAFLRSAYLDLRRVEHVLQMRAEEQTHTLPAQPAEFALLARTLGEEPEPFQARLDGLRTRVREIYAGLFGDSARETEIQEWTAFFTGHDPGPAIFPRLRGWFWGPLPPVEERLRTFLVGGSNRHLLTREHILLWLEISAQFDSALRPLAHPMNTLERINRFAARYGARKQFLRMCAHQPDFFRALCLLFDRSRFIHDLVCAHPEILEEIFLTGLRLGKSPEVIGEEIDRLPAATDDEFARWLWLFVKAEQVRLAIAGLLAGESPEALEQALSRLAEVVLGRILARVDPDDSLLVVALGKFGAAECTFGSDLDLLFLSGPEADPEATTARAQRLLRLAAHLGPLGRTFEIDTRLRPFGADGPLVQTLAGLGRYHQGMAGLWERQMLTRARPLPARAGGSSEALAAGFRQWRDGLLFTVPIGPSEVREIAAMRARIESEKVRCDPPQRAYKAGPGGLIDIEFLAQTLQLRHGWREPALRVPGTRAVLAAARAARLLPEDAAGRLLDHLDYLRGLEANLRRDRNAPVAEISDEFDDQVCVAQWMGFANYPLFWKAHLARLAEVRALFQQALAAEMAD